MNSYVLVVSAFGAILLNIILNGCCEAYYVEGACSLCDSLYHRHIKEHCEAKRFVFSIYNFLFAYCFHVLVRS